MTLEICIFEHKRLIEQRWGLVENIALVEGSFDPLSLDDVDFLHKSADLGYRLVVAVESDMAVIVANKRYPIFSQIDRMKIVAAIGCVDFVFDLPFCTKDEDRSEIYSAIKPSILVCGPLEQEIKQVVADKIGCKLIILESSEQKKDLLHTMCDGSSTALPLLCAGPVVAGVGMARKLDVPTYNIKIAPDLRIKEGVYLSKSCINGRNVCSISYYGAGRPDILESHVFADNMPASIDYMETTLLEFIRDRMVFDDLESLKRQVYLDVLLVKTKLSL